MVDEPASERPRPGPVVTVSASFGAGGSIVGPAVAERLGVPFLDRAIPARVAEQLSVPLEDALARDERRASLVGRIIAGMAAAAVPMGATPTVPADVVDDEEVFRSQTERVIREMAGRGGVILGLAGAIVLADDPRALHVRLDGARANRIAMAVGHQGLTEESAAKLLDATDRAREAYVRHFYKCHPGTSELYHLVIDSTRLPLDCCTELIVTAARARRGDRDA